MPRVKKLDLGMTALDELFMNDKERAENKLPKIFDIPLSEIDDFPGHPYRVLDDEDMSLTAFAANDDPLTVVNNLSDFIFGLIRAIGLIMLGFGIVQVGLSLKSHDPSQRANGFLTVAGGIVITFAKEILNFITG